MRFSALFLLICFFSFNVYASSAKSSADFEKQADFQVQKVNGNLKVNFSFNPAQLQASITNNTSANQLDELNYSFTEQIPVFTRNFRVLPGKSARTEVHDSEFSVIQDVECGQFLAMDRFKNISPDSDCWYPQSVVELGEPAILRDFCINKVSVAPFQFNPARNEVRIYNEIDYDIIQENSITNSMNYTSPTSISALFLPFYQKFLDWDESELDNYILTRGNVQVIIRNLATAPPAFHQWVEWKRQKGFELEFISEDDCNWNSSSIKVELQQRYDESEIKFDYIVIFGDGEGPMMVPAGSSLGETGSSMGDHGYACLAGNDILADVAYGRISVESNLEMVTYVNKVLSYERDPYMESTEWYTNGLVVAGALDSGISTIYTCEYASEKMIEAGYETVNEVYFNDNGGEINTRIVDGLNEGTSFHIYRGVAGSGLETDQILGLNNTNKLPFVIDITCGRGDWGHDFGINEAYMRAGSTTSPRGGIGAISTASSTHTSYNNCMVGGGVESVLVLKQPSMGEALLGCKLNLYNNFAAYYAQDVEYYNTTLNLMGDPTVWIWTNVPRDLTIDCDESFAVGQNGFFVNVSDDSGVLEGVWVTLYKSDVNEDVIGRGITDENGDVLLETPFRFSGEAILTVTARNAHPHRQTITVNASSGIGINSFTIIDDGSAGSTGNGNGIAENGETVGFRFSLHNYGATTQQNISVSLTSSDSWVEDISGLAGLTSLNAGATAVANDVVLVEITDNIPDGWIIELQSTVNTNTDSFDDNLSLPVQASNYICTEVLNALNLQNGQTGQISFNLTNIGHGDGVDADINLQSQGTWLTINNSSGQINGIIAGQSQTTSDFQVTVSQNAFTGSPVNVELVMSFDDGRVQNLMVQVPLGQKSADDPAGPDSYGYFAIDNIDYNYLFSTEYNWWEICPAASDVLFPGENLNLNDYDNNQDTSTVINLPFTFQYYGQDFDEITVSSNGWIAMGDQANFANGRNWSIPSPLGPDGMIAPFWDDRTIDENLSSSGVFAYYAQSMGMFIIEWNHVLNIHGSCPCTFQLVLFEQNQVNPSDSGDNEFLFQYKIVENEAGDISDVPYWTTGIENLEQTDGLQLAFWNDYYPGTEEMDYGRSIFFTTRLYSSTGIIHGQVVYSDSGDPVENVIVSSNYGGTVDTTDAQGQYQIEVPSGIVALVFKREGFDTVVEEQITVYDGSQIELNTTMGVPVFLVSPERLDVVLDEDEVRNETLNIRNNGQDNIEYTISVLPTHPNSSGQLGDIEGNSQIIEIDENLWFRYSFIKDNQIWVIAENGFSRTEIFKFTLEGELIVSSSFPSYYYRDFQPAEGNNLYAFQMWNMKEYSIDEELAYPTLINTTDLTFSINGPACYDYENGYYFVVDWLDANHIDIYSFEQELIGTIDTDITKVGSIILNYDDPDGKYLLYFGSVDDEWGDPLWGEVRRVDPSDGESELVFSTGPIRYCCGGDLSLLTYNDPLNMSLAIFNELPYPVMTYYRYLPTVEFATLNSEGGVIQPGEEQNLILNLDGTLLPAGNFNVWVVFEHDAPSERFIVPVTVQVGGSDIDTNQDILPEKWALEKVWPNPFNPVTNVQFSLKENADVNLKLYNIMGQEVLTIMNGRMNAGVHSMTINGSNLASGIYFVHLQAGPLNEVRKIMLIK